MKPREDEPTFEAMRLKEGNGSARAANKGKVKRRLKFARRPRKRHRL